ncbi:unnamed protein product [Effrenium voratum]|nr:unnamed protein product [Effrenium voratum]
MADKIGCSWRYVAVCFLLPALHGNTVSVLWAACPLYFRDMGWALEYYGLAVSVGCGMRILMQQLQLHCGPWIVLPLVLLHLAALFPALLFPDLEWAVLLQVGMVFMTDISTAIDAICITTWQDSEEQASRAASMVLSVFTISYAGAATLGGAVFDLFGWHGLVIVHFAGVLLEVLLLFTEPACWASVRKLCSCCRRGTEVRDMPEESKAQDEQTCMVVRVVNASETVDSFQGVLPGIPILETNVLVPVKGRGRSCSDQPADTTPAAEKRRNSHCGVFEARVDKLFQTETSKRLGKVSRTSVGQPVPMSKVRLGLPALLITLNAFNNYFAYATEYMVFAIFFREQHGWTSATWAGVAQTAGDLVAAGLMQLPKPWKSETEPAGCRKWLGAIVSKPYNLSCVLALWVVMNLAMASPWLWLAIVSQVLMGTIFVFSMKMVTELNLFYSRGDTGTYVALQVFARNAESMGSLLTGPLSMYLYEQVHPVAPFLLSSAISLLVFLVYTAGFCGRLGCTVDGIEAAEQRRDQRLGLKPRASTWRS